ncbi:MAG: MFS transporter [Bacteroidia bacterium]
MNAPNTSDKKTFAALKIKDFSFFVSARFFLTLANQMQGLIVGWQIYEFTKNPLWLGMIGLAEALPFICTALFAGHIADIVPRKKIILIAMSGVLISSFALAYFSYHNSAFIKTHGVLPIYGVIFLTGIARAFIGPSFFAFMSQIVPRELYSNAATWNSAVWQTGAIGGPALGGFLYVALGAEISYQIVFCLAAFAFLLFLFIAAKPISPKEKKESLFESLGVGIRFVFKNQIILGALSLDLFAVFFGGAVALLPIFAAEVLKVGPTGLGILRAAPSVGAVIMSFIMAYFPPMKNAGKKMLFAVGGFGICMILFAISPYFYLSVFVLALSGACDNVSVIVRSTALQLMTPDNMRGRVSAVNNIFIGSSNEIGEFESGLAAHWMGLIRSVIFGGCMTLLVTGITSKKAPKLRELNLDDFK